MAFITHPLRIAHDNLASRSGATVSASSEETALPATNLKNQQVSKVWRTKTEGSHTVDFTLPSSDDVRFVALNNHNMSSGATISIVGATNASFSPEGIRSGLTWTSDLILGLFGTAQNFTYWRFEVADNNSDNYIEVGHAFIGDYSDFDQPDFNSRISKIDPAELRRSYDGALSVFEKSKIHAIEVDISAVQQADRRSLETIYDENGQGTGMYVLLDPKNSRDSEDVSNGLDGLHRFTFWTRMANPVNLQHLSSDWHDRSTLVFEELV